MSQPSSQPYLAPVVTEGAERTPAQVAQEAAMREVADTLLNIEQAIKRADRARRTVAVSGREPNVEVALSAAVDQLEQVRKDLFQGAYFGGDQQRLI